MQPLHRSNHERKKAAAIIRASRKTTTASLTSSCRCVTYSDPFGLCDTGKICPGDELITGIANGLNASIAQAGKILAGAVDALTGIFSSAEAIVGRDLDGNRLSGGSRALFGATAVGSLVMTPEGAQGAHIAVDEGRAALNTLMAGDFKVMAGAGTASPYRAAAGLAGSAADWQYRTSKSVLEINGFKWQAHWAYNTATGETALAKLKAVGFVK